MNYTVQTKYDELCLVIKISVFTPTVVRIKIFDAEKPKIVFTNRFKTIRNSDVFHIRMPISSNTVIVSVYDNKKGNVPNGQEKNIRVTSIERIPLEKRLDVVDINNKMVAYFIDFAQRFSFNSPYLECNKTYRSDDNQFTIEYLPVIKASDGKEMKTPARISKTTGRIQVSKKHFDDYTVPMRFAVLCHEFSHFYVNENMSDEMEADINGLLIYLGLGYPRTEGYQAFLEVFKDSSSPQNKKRLAVIEKFIKDFEKNNFVLR